MSESSTKTTYGDIKYQVDRKVRGDFGAKLKPNFFNIYYTFIKL